MKIKSDFITNSSSSSFLVFFDELPKTAEEMKKALFKDGQNGFANPYNNFQTWNADYIAEYVLTHGYAPNEEEMKDLLYNFNGDERMEVYEKYVSRNNDWDGYQKEMLRLANESVKKITAENEGKKTMMFVFSDNNGDLETSLEHGEIFRNLPHLKNSMH